MKRGIFYGASRRLDVVVLAAFCGRSYFITVSDSDYMKRGYLLPEGCKDLIDVIKLQKRKSPAEEDTCDEEAKILEAELEAESQHGPVPLPPVTAELFVSEQTTVADLARMLEQKPFKIIADLMEHGVFANAKQLVPIEAMRKIARKYGYSLERL